MFKQGSLIHFPWETSGKGKRDCHKEEVGPSGIRVNVISPGLIETPMLALMPENQKKKLISRLPLQRVGYPRDLIGLAFCQRKTMNRYAKRTSANPPRWPG